VVRLVLSVDVRELLENFFGDVETEERIVITTTTGLLPGVINTPIITHPSEYTASCSTLL